MERSVGFFSKIDLEGVNAIEFLDSLKISSRNRFMESLEKDGWHRAAYLFTKSDITLLILNNDNIKLASNGYTVFHGECKNMTDLAIISRITNTKI